MEGNCLLCGEKSRLFEAIDSDEIKEMCALCVRKNNLPIIRKATSEQIQKENRFISVRERLSKDVKKEIIPETEKLNERLKTIVEEKIKSGSYEDLIDNFHWIIQHTRRRKKLSQKQLAEAIAEPEVLVSMAEKAQLPDDYERVISKLEQFLSIKIRKNQEKITGIEKGEFDIKKANLFDVTTTDLKNLELSKETEELKGDEVESDEIELIEEDLIKD